MPAISLTGEAENLLDQIKEVVISWLKENWWKLLLGIAGVLGGTIVLNIVTGGAIGRIEEIDRKNTRTGDIIDYDGKKLL